MTTFGKLIFISMVWGAFYLAGAFIGWDAGWVMDIPEWAVPLRVALIFPIGFCTLVSAIIAIEH